MTDDPRIDPADLRNVRFPGSSRRYDARAVDQFLETVAERIDATNALVDELQRTVAEAAAEAPPGPAPAAPELSTMDDDDLVRLIGEETASVLSTARRAGEEIRSKAEDAAARMIREATAEADRAREAAEAAAAEMTSEAEQALAAATEAAEAEAARIRGQAEEDATTLEAETRERVDAELAAAEARRAEADAEVEQILADAREEGRGMVAEAKEVRTRILEDLQRRRDMAREQIERLLAGRERLLAAYELVRENLDDITGQLSDSLPDPRDLPEPELPDGFVGIVGMAADDGAAGDGGVGDEADGIEVDEVEVHEVEAGSDAADVDDTVAPPDDELLDADEDPGTDRVEDAEPVEDPGPGPGPDVVDEDPEPVEDPGPAPGVDEDADRDLGAAGDPASDQPPSVDAAGTLVDAGPVDGAGVDDEPAETTPGEDGVSAGGDVDALFARLRAEREQSVARAQEVLEGDAPDAGSTEPGDPVARDPEAEAQPAQVDAPGPSPDVDRVPAEHLADPDALAQRAEALGAIDRTLSRALKRQLADEQNELLDLLRRSGATTADELLPPADDQIGTYARVASAHLHSAAQAGAAAAGDPEVEVDVDELARTLGATLVEPFRRRVERSAADVDGDPDELDERLRALYREWKAQHIGAATQDALLTAYAIGTLATAGDGRVRWCIDPEQGPCPDAQDNALAGPVAAGAAFPTGDSCPQAHPGCRCLLVIA